MKGHSPSGRKGKHVVVFACGNIGSQAIPLICRLPNVSRLTLVDADSYEEKNLFSQAITRADLGQPKARVQARRASQINPSLNIRAIVDRLENVPPAILRGDVIVAGLDSKESRRCANEIAWRLKMPWVDAGIEPSQMLVRVNVYFPGANQPCLECGWSAADYANLSIVQPCERGELKTTETNAPACLGALAAAISAVECQKIVEGRWEETLIGRQVILEMNSYRQFVTTFRRNDNCRFDHKRWRVTPFPLKLDGLTIGTVLKLAGRENLSSALSFGGQAVVKRLNCPGCGWTRRIFRLQRRLRKEERVCRRCGHEMFSAGFHMKTRLSRADLGPGEADFLLTDLGVRAGDIICLSNQGGRKYFEFNKK